MAPLVLGVPGAIFRRRPTWHQANLVYQAALENGDVHTVVLNPPTRR